MDKQNQRYANKKGKDPKGRRKAAFNDLMGSSVVTAGSHRKMTNESIDETSN